VHYQKSKDSLYAALDVLRGVLADNQNYLTGVSAVDLTERSTDVGALLAECAGRQSTFESQSGKV
jgi:hypothetical protein